MSEDERETPKARASRWLAAARLAAIFLATLGLYACFAAGWLARRGEAGRLAAGTRWSRRWARAALWLAGIRYELHGPPPPPGSLIAPNHFTWLDVIVLMAATPTFFVAREDVARWPVVGFFTRGVGTVFHRRARADRALVGTTRQVRRILAAGQSVTIFLEGTTHGGLRVLPFRSSLVQAAVDAGARVVPVGLIWRAARPGVDVLDDVGWWRPGRPFGPHAWRLLGLRGVGCEVRFGPASEAAGADRKTLARGLEAQVRRLAETDGPP